jgi:hypothetical protein
MQHVSAVVLLLEIRWFRRNNKFQVLGDIANSVSRVTGSTDCASMARTPRRTQASTNDGCSDVQTMCRKNWISAVAEGLDPSHQRRWAKIRRRRNLVRGVKSPVKCETVRQLNDRHEVLQVHRSTFWCSIVLQGNLKKAKGPLKSSHPPCQSLNSGRRHLKPHFYLSPPRA